MNESSFLTIPEHEGVSLREKVSQLFENHYVAAHDIKHVLRVAGLAKKIAQGEGYNTDEAEAAALLHDVGRLAQEDETGHAEAGEALTLELLSDFTDFSFEAKERILSAVTQHSQKESTGELAHILQDADKLDGLGAIGLVRAYTSKSHLADYAPGNVIVAQGSRDAKTISEQVAFQMGWYSMLYTETAKEIAKQRFEFMQEFMRELDREVTESV